MAKKRGQPTKYEERFNHMAFKSCMMGATDPDLAELFNVTVTTIKNWKNEHPDFFAAIKAGKDERDNRVEKSLLERATGYSCQEDKVFNNNGEPMIVPTTKHYPPETAAMIFWLKNRQPERWRDKREVYEDGPGRTINVKFELGEDDDKDE